MVAAQLALLTSAAFTNYSTFTTSLMAFRLIFTHLEHWRNRGLPAPYGRVKIYFFSLWNDSRGTVLLSSPSNYCEFNTKIVWHILTLYYNHAQWCSALKTQSLYHEPKLQWISILFSSFPLKSKAYEWRIYISLNSICIFEFRSRFLTNLSTFLPN